MSDSLTTTRPEWIQTARYIFLQTGPWTPIQECLNEACLDYDRLRNALEIIASRTYPATYLGKREDGTLMYGGSDDASQYARRILNGEQVS